MMYQKAILFNDRMIADALLETESPKDQKDLGRKVRNYVEEVWVANRERVVENGNYYKFLNGRGDGEGEEGEAPGLLKKLLATGDRELVEASPYDKIWGIGCAAKGAESRRNRWGQNLLGLAIMRARERLVNERKIGESE
jgi:ribA/ribD-fused uncharacterized protein